MESAKFFLINTNSWKSNKPENLVFASLKNLHKFREIFINVEMFRKLNFSALYIDIKVFKIGEKIN